MADAENLFRQHTVKPYMEEVRHVWEFRCISLFATFSFILRAIVSQKEIQLISVYLLQVITEQFINSHPNGLSGMYNELLEFIPGRCKCLRDITSGGMHG